MRQEVYGKGTTIEQIHQEVAPDVTYVSFWRAFHDQVAPEVSLQDVTIRRVQGILRLAKSYPITPESLEHACRQALTFNKTRLAYIKHCALYFVTHGHRPTLLTPLRQPDTVHLHQPALKTGSDHLAEESGKDWELQ